MPTLSLEFSDKASLEARGISHFYGRNTVLQEINLRLRRGELTALIGPNGAGKSTLLQIMQGMLTPSAGHVLIGGVLIQSCRQQIALMPQRGRIDWSFPITALEMVRLRQPRQRPTSRCMTAQEALERVGLGHRVKDRLGMLSGGQQQRVLLAAAIAQNKATGPLAAIKNRSSPAHAWATPLKPDRWPWRLKWDRVSPGRITPALTPICSASWISA